MFMQGQSCGEHLTKVTTDRCSLKFSRLLVNVDGHGFLASVGEISRNLTLKQKMQPSSHVRAVNDR